MLEAFFLFNRKHILQSENNKPRGAHRRKLWTNLQVQTDHSSEKVHSSEVGRQLRDHWGEHSKHLQKCCLINAITDPRSHGGRGQVPAAEKALPPQSSSPLSPSVSALIALDPLVWSETIFQRGKEER